MKSKNIFFLRCPKCRTKNRIPLEKAGQPAKCGKCGGSFRTDLYFTGKPIIVNDSDFDLLIIKSPLPILLDCWAPWCGPCKIIAPVLDQLAAEWKGRGLVGKLNVDENPIIAGDFKIVSIPTMMIFNNGDLIDRLVGALPRREIIQKMAPHL